MWSKIFKGVSLKVHEKNLNFPTLFFLHWVVFKKESSSKNNSNYYAWQWLKFFN